MDIIRDAIVTTLQGKFPAMGDSIQPFIGLLDEQSETQISYRAPGVLVCILPFNEAPEDIAPWELQGEFALVLSVKGASALVRDKEGWKLCKQLAQVTYRNTWGVNPLNIRPAIITNVSKNTARNPDGTPTGVNYWTILFHNWMNFEAMF